MRLRSVRLLHERINDWNTYPFTVPTIRTLETLEIRSRICFFVGENGSGKSTLLEAIADNYGFGREGGSRNFYQTTSSSSESTAPLSKALRISFTTRTGQGFYLRAESFFNVATLVDQLGIQDGYGGRSLHEQSHGESFLSLLENRFRRKGFYVLDEPEAALSPQRQLSMLALLHSRLEANDDIQFLIASHSPILLAYPGAQIFSFDDGTIHEIGYKETSPYQVVSRFLARPEVFLNELFNERPERE
ncbi:AAA family ATPase [Acidipila sp. 4G-K13]|nr:AAA family ATPase [Paracidobacterium acidisoli]